MNDSTLMYLQPLTNRYLGALDLGPQYTTQKSAQTITWTFRTPASAEPTTEFRITLIRGLTHQYPNGTNLPLALCDPLWAFFSQYSLPVTSVENPPSPAMVRIYPNPASDFIRIEGQGDMVIRLRNMLGQVVHAAYITDGGTIRLPQLATGVYFAEVRSERAVSHQLVHINRRR